MVNDKIDEAEHSCQPEWVMGGIATGAITSVVEEVIDGVSTARVAMLDIVARLTTGREMPDGTVGPAGNVLVVGEEDDVRLLKGMEADLERVDLVRPDQGFTIPDGIENLIDKVGELKPRLVVIPGLVGATSPGINVAQAPDLDVVLNALDHLTGCGCAVLVVISVFRRREALAILQRCADDDSGDPAPAEGVLRW